MWQQVIAVAGLVLAAPTSVIAAATFKRTARVADVAAVTEAQKVGLEYLRESLKMQQQTIVHQAGELGELRGALSSCKEERGLLADRIADLERKTS